MSSSYEKMNYISSFGFSNKWRKQVVSEIKIEKNKTVVDLMTGMGECWKYILKTPQNNTKLIALDFAAKMLNEAKKKKNDFSKNEIEILNENVFNNSIANQTADYVFSGFGLKTLNEEQLKNLAKEINRILKPNGKFALIEISVPKNKLFKAAYLFYLKKIIPIIGKLFLGNPETYKMLGVYTEKFNDAKQVLQIFKSTGFEVTYLNYFMGCATGIKGTKS